MFRYLGAHPQIRSLVWFDVQKQTDWRITSRQEAAAFAAGLHWLSQHPRSRAA
jgi:hypothetical protein